LELISLIILFQNYNHGAMLNCEDQIQREGNVFVSMSTIPILFRKDHPKELIRHAHCYQERRRSTLPH